MSTILIAALSFVAGAITGGVALLAFAAWATKDFEKMDREYRAEMDWKNNRSSDELIEASSPNECSSSSGAHSDECGQRHASVQPKLILPILPQCNTS
jgi:uncharacterized protein YeaO (DUF488 family)